MEKKRKAPVIDTRRAHYRSVNFDFKFCILKFRIYSRKRASLFLFSNEMPATGLFMIGFMCESDKRCVCVFFSLRSFVQGHNSEHRQQLTHTHTHTLTHKYNLIYIPRYANIWRNRNRLLKHSKEFEHCFRFVQVMKKNNRKYRRKMPNNTGAKWYLKIYGTWAKLLNFRMYINFHVFCLLGIHCVAVVISEILSFLHTHFLWYSMPKNL